MTGIGFDPGFPEPRRAGRLEPLRGVPPHLIQRLTFLHKHRECLRISAADFPTVSAITAFAAAVSPVAAIPLRRKGATGSTIFDTTSSALELLLNMLSFFDKFYQAAASSGALKYLLNEYIPACVKSTTTGGNIHVVFGGI